MEYGPSERYAVVPHTSARFAYFLQPNGSFSKASQLTRRVSSTTSTPLLHTNVLFSIALSICLSLDTQRSKSTYSCRVSHVRVVSMELSTFQMLFALLPFLWLSLTGMCDLRRPWTKLKFLRQAFEFSTRMYASPLKEARSLTTLA